jgi:hypothetical protein
MDLDDTMIQKLMTEAYERWRETPQWTMQAFWDQLSDEERYAVFIGNMNYQVENGGWIQWVDNRYGNEETCQYLIEACKKIGTESAIAVKVLIELVKERLAELQNPDPDDDRWQGLAYCMGKLDLDYYEVKDQFMIDAEDYLTKGALTRPA